MSRLRRSRTATAALAAVVLGAVVWWTGTGAENEDVPRVPAPFEVTVAEWDKLLIGDAARTEQTYTQLADTHPGLDDAAARKAGQLAVDVVTADLTGAGRDRWPDYWPPVPTTTTTAPVRCEQASALAASPAAFEVIGKSGRVVDWVKVLVPYAGTCGEAKYTLASPGVEYVYLQAEAGTTDYEPVRDWAIPATDPDEEATAELVEDWQLAQVGPCGLADDTVYRARTLVVDAFAKMCDAAAKEDVVLVVESGYRTRAAQQDLFEAAVEHYGSVERAREWVAYADEESCESKHCAGLALNVEPDHAATTWLSALAGCATVEGALALPGPDGTCADGTTPVKQSQLYGFVAPVPRIPGYLEFVLPTGDAATSVPDCSPSGQTVDKMVASVFRCRLQRADVDPATVEQVVAEALVVSKCASGWNPSARVFAGQYAATPHPESGRYFTEAGVFALRDELVTAGWVQGKATDPVVNINAAASLWLATRGWEQFACATGTDPGLVAGPVLPSYGGPPIPDWARQY